MKYTVRKPLHPLNVEIVLPASKSISNRLLIMHALSGQEGGVENLSDSDDTTAMINALRAATPEKDIGHAGTSMRFLTAYYSCVPGSVVMTGSDRMKQRPIGPLVDALRRLGAGIRYTEKDGYPPLAIDGRKLMGGELTINGSISSQFISALLMIAPALEHGLVLHLEGEIVSSAYIHMTLELMHQHGVEYRWKDNTISVFPGSYRGSGYRVESDWSAASYWYSMVLFGMHSVVHMNYLKRNSLQGDSSLVDIFSRLGVTTDFGDDGITVSTLARVTPGLFEYDFTNSPDLVQTMAVALCMLAVPFRFTGTRTLRIKETDRILALQTEMRKLGFVLDSDPEGSYLSWEKQTCKPEKEPVIATYHDHRMAMAFAPAALVLGSISIEDPMVVTKSYPAFWEDLGKAGFNFRGSD
jgi:3-phosphoshikimate 1-carboxyvinyltransferase